MAFAATAAAAAPIQEETRTPGTPAARVGGVDISRAAVNDLVKSVLLSARTPPESAEIGRLSDSALQSLIDLEVLYQEAQRRGITVSDAAVDAEIERVRGHFSDAGEFSDALRRSNLSHAQLRADTRKTLMVDALLRTVVWPDIHISDAQVRAFYAQNRQALSEALGEAPAVHVREIVLDADKGDASRQRAEKLRSELVAGADFAELASNYSTDRTSAARGGDRGFLQRDQMPPAVAAAAFQIPVGSISEVIRAADGFHILQVVERKSGRIPPLEEVRASIEAMLADDEREARKKRFVAELRENAEIEVFPPFAPIRKQEGHPPSPLPTGRGDAPATPRRASDGGAAAQ